MVQRSAFLVLTMPNQCCRTTPSTYCPLPCNHSVHSLSNTHVGHVMITQKAHVSLLSPFSPLVNTYVVNVYCSLSPLCQSSGRSGHCSTAQPVT